MSPSLARRSLLGLGTVAAGGAAATALAASASAAPTEKIAGT